MDGYYCGRGESRPRANSRDAVNARKGWASGTRVLYDGAPALGCADDDRRAGEQLLLRGIRARISALDPQEGAVCLSRKRANLTITLLPSFLASSSFPVLAIGSYAVPQCCGFLGDTRQAASELGWFRGRGRPKWVRCSERPYARGGGVQLGQKR